MNKKTTLSALIALLTTGAIFSAQAANPTANIEIKGVIEPSACDVVVHDVADFGTLKRADLIAADTAGILSAGSKNVTFSISCDGKTRTGITLQATGGQDNTGPLMNKDATIGGYHMQMKDVKLDNVTGQILSSIGDTSKVKSHSDFLNLAAAETLSWFTGQTTTTTPAKQVTGTIQVSAFFNEDAISVINDKIEFNGTTVMEVKYL